MVYSPKRTKNAPTYLRAENVFRNLVCRFQGYDFFKSTRNKIMKSNVAYKSLKIVF